MIDSFSAAADCAEEALRDPGGLRFAHVPSLVAFVTRLRTGRGGTDRDPRELAEGVRLNRLLWELGLRSEAAQLFDVLRAELSRLPLDTDRTVAAGNALAVVGMRLGRAEDVAELLGPMTLEMSGTEVDEVLVLTTSINLAVVTLTLGYADEAASHARTARSLLRDLDVSHGAAAHEVLAALEWRLAETGHGTPTEPTRIRPGSAWARLRPSLSPLSAFAAQAAVLAREVGDDDPRAFFSVAGLAVARVTAALREGDSKALSTAVQVLEVTCQRLSAMLGADHPEVLGVLADQAAVQVEAARVTRSPARLERAVAQLASVSGRLDARLGPDHPRSVATLTNLVTAQVEAVRASDEAEKADKAEQTARALTEQARRAGERLGEHHPVTRLVRASSRTCRRIASRGDDLWGHGSTMLVTLSDMPQGWATGRGAYRSFDETMGQLDRGGLLAEDPWLLVGPRFAGLINGMDELLADTPRGPDPAPGKIVFGTVVGRRHRDALLVLDGDSGVVPADELSLQRGADPLSVVQVGDRVQSMALGRRDADGNVVLSLRRARAVRAWSELETLKAENGFVTGTVIDLVRGGLVLDVGVRAFMPSGLADRQRGYDLGPLLSNRMRAKIIELDRLRGLVHLSRRAGLEEADVPPHAGVLRRGQIRTGRVIEVLKDGVLVDVGDAIGRISRSELSWRNVDAPSDVLSAGVTVTVRVLDPDVARGRAALSLKAAHDGPWRAFTRSHRPGEIIEAVVTKRLSFGLLVQVKEGIDGLVHRSELADRRMIRPGEDFQALQGFEPGDPIFVVVTDIDYDRRRLSFSLKEADEVARDGSGDAPVTTARYGMAAYYDSRGTLHHPDGYDAEVGAWLPGFSQERKQWERQWREAAERCERHRTWFFQRRYGPPRR